MSIPKQSGRANRSAAFVISHSHFGGAQELWANLVGGLRHRSWDTRLIALYPDDEGEQQTPDGIEWDYVVASRPRNAAQALGLINALARKLRGLDPDMVVTALPAANVAVPIAVTKSRISTRVIATHHTPSATYSRTLDAADAWTGCLPCVRQIVCVSDAVAASLAGKPKKYRSKLMTIRNAVPPAIESLLERLATDRSVTHGRGRKLVCSGRLAPQKNYPVVVRAMQHLPDVVVRIIGGGPDESLLRAMANDLEVADRIDFVGQKSRTEALELVSHADIFVQMSLFEGNSLSLIEAMKLGIPLIVSNVPEQREAIIDSAGRTCGLVVDTHDDGALGAAVRRLLDQDSEYEQYADASRRLGRQIHFSDVVSAYESLAE